MARWGGMEGGGGLCGERFDFMAIGRTDIRQTQNATFQQKLNQNLVH
jgi:hypothetical protein